MYSFTYIAQYKCAGIHDIVGEVVVATPFGALTTGEVDPDSGSRVKYENKRQDVSVRHFRGTRTFRRERDGRRSAQ